MVNYDDMTKTELIILCGERQLALTGSKNSLVIRLKKADSKIESEPKSEPEPEPVKVSKAKKTTALSDEEFVRAEYLTVLKRDADDGGLAHYVHLLQSGNERSFVTSDLADSKEAKLL